MEAIAYSRYRWRGTNGNLRHVATWTCASSQNSCLKYYLELCELDRSPVTKQDLHQPYTHGIYVAEMNGDHALTGGLCLQCHTRLDNCAMPGRTNERDAMTTEAAVFGRADERSWPYECAPYPDKSLKMTEDG
jgi:hypothetical protein